MTAPILYCGDTELTGAASYLAGLMSSWGWKFDYLPSHVAVTPQDLTAERSLIIISDYPSTQFSRECQQLALKLIEQGCGLLMIGGWESYHGFGGNWDSAPLAEALPVTISSKDDRVNFPQSAWLQPAAEHPIVSQLPWAENPPAIGGMNRVAAKQSSSTVLNAHSFRVASTGPAAFQFQAAEVLPALVVGDYQKGRTASFLSDVAPHWVGGLVDWGPSRVTAQADQSVGIEVGSDYARFWKQLLEWCMNGKH